MNNEAKHTVQSITALLNKRLKAIYAPQESIEITRILLEEITGRSRTKILSCPLEQISQAETKQILKATHRLEQNEPIQYILGKAWFYGLEFKVNSHTLIPRPETEELVQKALELFSKNHHLPKTFIDAATGSGCIAISAAHENKELKGFAFDINRYAIECAIVNAKMHNTNVEFFIDDMLNFSGSLVSEPVGMLISNPPYVMPSEKALMRKNVTAYEPEGALYAPQDNPLLFYQELKQIALRYVVKGGYILFEINEALSKAMIKLYSEDAFKNIEVFNDMRGKPRIFKCLKS